MAILLKRQHRLPTLVLSAASPGRETQRQTVFTLQVGDDTVDTLTTPTETLQIPLDLRDLRNYEYRDPPYHVPPEVRARIRTHLPAMLPPGAPLWLLFDASSRFLPLVPWEQLLQAELGVPLLRVPNFLLDPVSDPHALDVVLCASSPVTEPSIPLEEVLLRILGPLLATVQRRVRVDVFVDGRAAPGLQALVAQLGAGDQVRVHDPFASAALGETRPDANRAPGALWLDWIVEALGGRTADLVYFVAHGCLSGTDGLLLLAESPRRNRDREIFVDARQLDSFLTAVGAWAFGLSAPPQNYSGSGLRLLAEQLALARPGPLLVHDHALDPGGEALAAAADFLFNGTGLAPASPALSLYCHPAYVRPEIRGGYNLSQATERIADLTLARHSAVAELLQSKGSTPPWVAKSQRYLEKTAAEFERTAALEDQPSITSEGYERGLRLVADVLADYALASPSTTFEQSDDEERGR